MEGAHDNKRSPSPNYEYKVEQRAVKHREISHRNNTTSCRSPTRDLDTRWIKNELHRKRQFEFFKRRPVDHGTYTLLSAVPRHRYSRETLHKPEFMTQTFTSIRRPLITSPNVKLQRDGINFANQVHVLYFFFTISQVFGLWLIVCMFCGLYFFKTVADEVNTFLKHVLKNIWAVNSRKCCIVFNYHLF